MAGGRRQGCVWSMTTELRADVSPASGRSRVWRLLAVLVLMWGGLVLVDLLLGDPDLVAAAGKVMVFAIVFTVVFPYVEYRVIRWKARRKAGPTANRPGSVLPCGVVEWSKAGTSCVLGGLALPVDPNPPTWRPLTATDTRQLVLPRTTWRLIGYRTPNRRERWGVGMARLVIVALANEDDEESHLCLTVDDARTVAALYPTAI